MLGFNINGLECKIKIYPNTNNSCDDKNTMIPHEKG